MTVTRANTCCGCGCCAAACPFDAISLKEDSHGFCYPVLDQQRCRHCGICDKVCAFRRTNVVHRPVLDAYAVWASDRQKRCSSQSGGLAAALSQAVVRTQGIVYGCVQTEPSDCVHVRGADVDVLDSMRGSKYIQSRLEQATYASVEQDLLAGKKVLFTGTPCQTAAVDAYLAQKKCPSEKLYLMELICHGVPGHAVWREYLVWMAAKHGPVCEACFRDKKFGWHCHKETLKFESGETINQDIYARLFWKDLILRESCYECPYHGDYRVADLTVGDFWGIENTMPADADEAGVSLCLVRTQKGKVLLEETQSELVCHACHTDAYLQKSLQEATKKPKEYNAFWKTYDEKGAQAAIKKYGQIHLGDKILNHMGRRRT